VSVIVLPGGIWMAGRNGIFIGAVTGERMNRVVVGIWRISGCQRQWTAVWPACNVAWSWCWGLHMPLVTRLATIRHQADGITGAISLVRVRLLLWPYCPVGRAFCEIHV
jgi:hypothetical protein